IVSLWVLALATLAIARLAGYGPAQLGIVTLPVPRTIGIAAILTAAAVALLFAFRFAGLREAPIMKRLMPASPAERRLFVGVSVSAGVCEEIVFRGFLIHVLYGASG